MPPAITADRLSKTFKVKVRDPGLKGALQALLKPRYRDVHAVRDVTFGIEPGGGGPAFKRRIALVLGNRQQLVWDLPPEETFQLNRAIYDIAESDYRERLAELVALLELEDLLDKPVRQLSLGERMKCELAAALLHHPPI